MIVLLLCLDVECRKLSFLPWHESYYVVVHVLFSNQVDIQALAHAVELTRQGAVDSLRFAKGDLFQAFQVKNA